MCWWLRRFPPWRSTSAYHWARPPRCRNSGASGTSCPPERWTCEAKRSASFDSEQRGGDSVFLTREVEEHGDVLVSFAPGPGFREVVGVVEAKDEVMLVTGGG